MYKLLDGQKADRRLHLPALDGIRGLSALYVLVFHVTCYSPFVQEWWTKPLLLGHHAVAVFIAISGFTLMMPLVSEAGERSKLTSIDSILSFYKRRALRILPPYYASIVFSLFVFVALQNAYGQSLTMKIAGVERSPFEPGILIIRVLLLHSLNTDWNLLGTNGAHWSISVEWLIYLVFPLVLLPVWRKFGWGALLAAGTLWGWWAFQFLPKYHLLSPWFVGVFAVGMVGAKAAFLGGQWSKKENRLCNRYCALIGGITALILLLTFVFSKTGEFGRIEVPQWWIIDYMVAVVVVSGLALLIRSQSRWLEGPRRFLSSKTLARLAAFSYSLYLVHMPVIFYVKLFETYLPAGVSYVLQILCALAVAYGFFLVCEAPIVAKAGNTFVMRVTKIAPPP